MSGFYDFEPNTVHCRNYKMRVSENIKNIGLAAAFYAASDGSAIEMSHLIKAARKHQKLERTWQMNGA
ncbi:hypothetical protein [Scytonema sp. PCC 10023]|uniref:hypothetical protein n=1 Tax=Scytonema sp. PCC 10023 TaxID=1680591 RepID=UPI0039C6C81F